MAFVSVPKDLSKVKNKVAFSLTSRQLICFGSAAAIGVPVYLLTRTAIGSSAAVLLMIALMLPLFFLAMYERDGLPAEKIIRNYLRAGVFWPGRRPYRTENFYAILYKEGEKYCNEKKSNSKRACRKR
jgi:hypothetical protein